jgi:hypothetical protein
MIRHGLPFFFTALTSLTMGSVSAEPIVCPASIPAANIRLLSVPEGWRGAIDPHGMALNSAGVMSGPPEDQALLKPNGRGAPNVEEWTDLRPGAFGIWMACFYGDKQEFTLSKRLDDTTRTCRVTYRGGKLGRHQVHIRCE